MLTILSQAGIVGGSPGPGGGYWLIRAPECISLYDVVALFERVEGNVSYPSGPDYCGNCPHCPLHMGMLQIREQLTTFLKSSTFSGFVGWDCAAEAAKSGSRLTRDLLPNIANRNREDPIKPT
jgi:DNA-binding IscR family transcriptional regulator